MLSKRRFCRVCILIVLVLNITGCGKQEHTVGIVQEMEPVKETVDNEPENADGLEDIIQDFEIYPETETNQPEEEGNVPEDPTYEEHDGYQKQVLPDDFGDVVLSEDTDYSFPAPSESWVEVSLEDKDGTYKALYVKINKVTPYAENPDYVIKCIDDNDKYDGYDLFDREKYLDDGLYIVDYEVYVPSHFEDRMINLIMQPITPINENVHMSNNGEEIKYGTVSDTYSAKVVKLYSKEDEEAFLEGGQKGKSYTLRGYYHLDQYCQDMSYSEYCLFIGCPPDGVKSSYSGEYEPYDREISKERLNAYLSLE